MQVARILVAAIISIGAAVLPSCASDLNQNSRSTNPSLTNSSSGLTRVHVAPEHNAAIIVEFATSTMPAPPPVVIRPSAPGATVPYVTNIPNNHSNAGSDTTGTPTASKLIAHSSKHQNQPR